MWSNPRPNVELQCDTPYILTIFNEFNLIFLAFGQPMSAYQSGGGMGGTTSENSLNRGMRPAPADIATPPPFGPVPNLSPHTYGQPTVSNNQFINISDYI